ncbi:8809_t:CDS:2 [Cetraspora pellucida]|uniref:8809_t:CDS:1 n=1 Tax=Cetraspora pellucida TaxID=1433469 RepID=A0ACA9MXF1_9GLOM|nr:8809_t:CDS:2 [Cetraspora pellucida]
MQDQRDKPKDLSEIDLLKQRIIDLETDNAEIPELKKKLLKFDEIEAENKRLRQIIEENCRRDAEFKSRIEELEKSRTDTVSENAKLKTEVAKLRRDFEEIKSKRITIDSSEQLPKQIGLRCNDTPASDITNNTSNSDVCQESSSQYPASPIHTEAKSSEDKEVDVFHNSIFNERVRKEKKLQDQEVSSGRQDTSEELMSSHPPSTNNDVSQLPAEDSNPEVKLSYSEPVAEQCHYHDKSSKDKAIDEFLDSEYREMVSKKIIQNIKEKKLRDQEKFITSQNAISSEIKIPYNQKVEQGLISELLEFIRSNDATIPQNSYSISEKQIFDLFKKNMTYYYYSEKYEKKVKTISLENNISDQMARTQIYDEMMLYLSGIKREYLRKMIQKAKNIYTLFKGIGIDKIRLITYSADAISRLTDTQVQNIIKVYTDELAKSQKLIGVNNCEHACNLPVTESQISDSKTKILSETKISMPVKPQASNVSSNLKTEASMSFMSPPKTKTLPRKQINPTHDRTYFCNKTLKQYPNLYRDGSSENEDYYGITDESLCPLCKLNHDEDGIEGRYKVGSYYIKCEQRGIEIEPKANKTLTPEYLEWEAKLTEFPGILTDKIRSRLYKRYKNKTGSNP